MSQPVQIENSPIDLHCHSSASDGGLSPTDLVQLAHHHQVKTLALTDHDTLAGLAEARAAAAQNGINLINGIELSAMWQEQSVHIVGLNIDPNCDSLIAGVALQQQRRASRAEQIAEALTSLGVHGILPVAQELAGQQAPTRPHFAKALVASGRCKDQRDAFRRFLGKGKAGDIVGNWADLETTVRWIQQAGGVAVVAHPLRYSLETPMRRKMLAAFRDSGGDAIEVCCGGAPIKHRKSSTKDANWFGLSGSIGSDFHSPAQPGHRLGWLLPLPKEVPAVWLKF